MVALDLMSMSSLNTLLLHLLQAQMMISSIYLILERAHPMLSYTRNHLKMVLDAKNDFPAFLTTLMDTTMILALTLRTKMQKERKKRKGSLKNVTPQCGRLLCKSMCKSMNLPDCL